MPADAMLFARALTAGIICAAAIAQQPPATLYERIGRYDGIAAVVDDFGKRMAADSRLARFFTSRGTDTRRRSRQLTIELLCESSGGPCVYLGRSMQTTHAGLGITETDWRLVVEHFTAAVAARKLPADTQKEFLALFTKYKDQIVTGQPGR